MDDKRSCAWMSGPAEGAEGISPRRWWLAITRDTFSKEHGRQQQRPRTQVTCSRTPAFVSPLPKRTK